MKAPSPFIAMRPIALKPSNSTFSSDKLGMAKKACLLWVWYESLELYFGAQKGPAKG